MKKIVSLIPARGGSKGIPLKNIADLNGRPLISYALWASIMSQVNETWVSTDNALIKEACKLEADWAGLKILDRPAHLAQDDSSTESVMLHFADNVVFDVIVLIQATSPMITAEQINKGLEKFATGKYDSLFSAVKTNDMLLWDEETHFCTKKVFLPLNYDPLNRGRRQTRKRIIFIETGGFFITTRKQLLESRCRMGGRIGIVEVPFWASFQVDTMEDLENIEKLMVLEPPTPSPSPSMTPSPSLEEEEV